MLDGGGTQQGGVSRNAPASFRQKPALQPAERTSKASPARFASRPLTLKRRGRTYIPFAKHHLCHSEHNPAVPRPTLSFRAQPCHYERSEESFPLREA